MYYSVLCILCDRRYHFYKMVLDTIFNCIIGFSVYFGVEIPEEFKTVYHYTYSSNVRHNFPLQYGVFYSITGLMLVPWKDYALWKIVLKITGALVEQR